MNKIAAECCGSCFDYVNCHCQLYGNKHESNYKCDSYTPRNPIENKYKKMWEELFEFYTPPVDELHMVQVKMKQIKWKYDNQLEKENNLD